MSESASLRSGWSTALIGDVCSLTTGGTPKSSEKSYYEGGTIKWLVSGDVHQREIYDCKGRITEAGLRGSNARSLPVGSVIIALNGQGKTRGTVAMLRTEATCNQSLVSINPRNRSDLLPEFLFWNLRGRYEEIRRMTGDDGNDRRGLNMPLIRGIRVPVPPPGEQKRIVEVLNQAFAALELARGAAEANLADARELQARELENVLSDPELGEWVPCGKHVDLLSGFAFKSTGYSENESDVRLVRGDNIVQGDFRWSGVMRWPASERAEYRKYELAKGDVLVAMDRTWVSSGIKYAIVDEKALPSLLVQRVARLRALPSLLPEYLAAWIGSPLFERYVLSIQTGLGVPHVSGGQLKSFKIRVPPLREQSKVITKLGKVLQGCKGLSVSYERKLADIASLRQSLLQAAFSGQLT